MLKTLAEEHTNQTIVPRRMFSSPAFVIVQSGAVYRSQGFEGNVLGSSSGWWAATVATYCPSRQVELPKTLPSKPCDR